MLNVTFASIKENIKVDKEKDRIAYEQLKKVQKKEAELKASYAEKGLEKPEIMA
jgi:hypothetical protein